MIEIKNKTMCSGCHACYNICPQSAIIMAEDEKGFKYPKIDKEKCINCGLCEKICPILNIKNKEHEISAYAVINKDEKVRLDSSSGGVFNLIANYVLDQKGIVFGATFDKDMLVKHISINNKNDIPKLMTSKYLQSVIGDTYKECKKYLNKGKKVLFTGTPCQIEGLLSYLNKEYDNLYTQDIICHGVPSPKIWKMYLKKLNKNTGQSPIQTNFRQKNSGWDLFELSILYPDSSYECSHNADVYMQAFLSNYTLRDSCYNCSFKKISRLSDITLGDFWGIDKIDKSMNDNKGTSLVIINSKKGEELLNILKKKCKIKAVDFDNSIKYNPAYFQSCNMPNKREEFFSEINEDNFDQVVNKYTKKSIYKRVLSKGKRIIKKIIGKK